MSLLLIVVKILAVIITAFGAPLASPGKRLSRFSDAPWAEVPLPLSFSGPPVNVPLPLPLALPLGPPPLAHHFSPSFLCDWPLQPHRTYSDFDGPIIISDGGPWMDHHSPWWAHWKPTKPFLPRPPCVPCGQPSPPPSSAAPSPAAPSPAAPAPTNAPAPAPADAGSDVATAEEPASVDTARANDGDVVAVNGNVNPAAVPDTPADPPVEEAAADPPVDEAAADPPVEEAAADPPAEETPAEVAPAGGDGDGAAALKSPGKEQSGEEVATEKPSNRPAPESPGEESGEATTESREEGFAPMKQEVSPTPTGSLLDTVKSSVKLDQILNEVPDDTTAEVQSKDSLTNPPV